MFKIFRRELQWGGRPLVLESGRLARQADGAVLVSYGETTVLCTAVAQRTVRRARRSEALVNRSRSSRCVVSSSLE